MLEEGNIYFLYTPKVNKEEIHSERGVQRFYILLAPKDRKLYRSIVIGQKELPGIQKHQRYWGYIESVFHSAEEVRKEFKSEDYETKTQGMRHQDSARLAGEGVYAIIQHGNHTHLIYELELPKKVNDVQEDLNIEEEGSYIISIKNPEQSSPKNVGLSEEEKANLPKNLQNLFEDRRFISVEKKELLDHIGIEILLIGATDDVKKDLNIDLDETKHFRKLKLNKNNSSNDPLFKGKWK